MGLFADHGRCDSTPLWQLVASLITRIVDCHALIVRDLRNCIEICVRAALTLLLGLMGHVCLQFRDIDDPRCCADTLVGSAFGLSWGSLSQTLMEASPILERDHNISTPADATVGRICHRCCRHGTCGQRQRDNCIVSNVMRGFQDAMINIFVSASALAVPALVAAIQVVKLVSRQNILCVE